jgi:hypothetical protein
MSRPTASAPTNFSCKLFQHENGCVCPTNSVNRAGSVSSNLPPPVAFDPLSAWRNLPAAEPLTRESMRKIYSERPEIVVFRVSDIIEHFGSADLSAVGVCKACDMETFSDDECYSCRKPVSYRPETMQELFDRKRNENDTLDNESGANLNEALRQESLRELPLADVYESYNGFVCFDLDEGHHRAAALIEAGFTEIPYRLRYGCG